MQRVQRGNRSRPLKTPLPIAGIVVAGGRSRRMGVGDKALLPLGDRSMLAHVINRFAPQVDTLVLNANGDHSRFASFGLPVIGDELDGFPGPLAGLLAGMRWVAENGCADIIATVPGDTPFIPPDLVTRLLRGLRKAEIVIARSGGQLHPLVGLWHVDVADNLAHGLRDQSHRSVRHWINSRNCTVVDFDDCGCHAFFNVNTPEDLLTASDRVAGRVQLHTPDAN